MAEQKKFGGCNSLRWQPAQTHALVSKAFPRKWQTFAGGRHETAARWLHHGITAAKTALSLPSLPTTYAEPFAPGSAGSSSIGIAAWFARSRFGARTSARKPASITTARLRSGATSSPIRGPKSERRAIPRLRTNAPQKPLILAARNPAIRASEDGLGAVTGTAIIRCTTRTA